MRSQPRSKLYRGTPGCVVGMVLVAGLIFAFLNFVEVVKFVGVAFLLIPNALGLVETVDRDEVLKVTLPNYAMTEIEFEQQGDYLIYLPTWEQFAGATIVNISNDDGHIKAYPVKRGTMPYDTTAANGYPEYKITIDQPGKYVISLVNLDQTLGKELSVSIVPDYISGNETVFIAVMGFQFLLIIMVIILFVIRRRLAARAVLELEDERQQTKRDEMGDFISHYKGGDGGGS